MKEVIKKIVVVFLISIGINMSAFAQDNPKVELIANYDSLENSILLRWAPNTSNLWMLAMEKGYTLEKFVYQKDGKLLSPPLQKIILSDKITPQPLNEWEQLALKNDYAAIAAQSIYGEYLEFDEVDNDIFSIVNKSKEQDARFSMTLFSADQSTAVADKAGLFFRDQNVQKDERYLYRIYANVQDSIIKADTGLIYYGPKDFTPLPQPIIRSSTQEDGMIQLYWLKAPYHNVFTNYIVQRTQDLNSGFKAVNKLPVLNTSSGPKKRNNYGVFVDTTQLSGTVYYRIIGEDAFGIKSEPSDTLEVKIMPDFEMPMPQIDTIYNDKEGKVFVNYSLKNDTQYIDKIFFERSDKADGKYKLIESDSILNHRNFIDKQPLRNNYYRIGVAAFDKMQYSMPSLFNLMDSIPPSTPSFKSYSLKDSTLTLKWNANSEKDLAGYRIYKSHYKNQEPSLVAEVENLDTQIQFVEKQDFINTGRFYYLVAVDKVGNSSKLSKAFKITLADKIPPSPPVIRDVNQHKNRIELSWILSSSTDVKNYLIYRKQSNYNNYELVGMTDHTHHSFIDEVSFKKNQNLFYRLVVIDSSGNENYTKAYSFNYVKPKNITPDYFIDVTEDIVRIDWDFQSSENSEFSKVKIYIKSEEGYRLYREKNIELENFSFEMKKIKKEDIKVIFI
ncbi:hypothetical protein QYS49_34330 [Marivirga salinae]|uniref:Fibronectin type-III domain-containing protein n=1 Tax=Marivirga salinarum TaxID=3059078 RepID=A0AA51NCP8_9BACT|nr:hypothetical protein [Marivirga sp. BDSF4-3]WMN12695.1 hypothetical protein QYS49_34330 [Marivirga sp. BDSF4-3]